MLNMLKRNASAAALVVAVIALFVAIGGVAGALPGKNSVDSSDIKKNSVKSSDVKNDGLKGVDIKESTLDIPKQALPQNVYGFVWLGGKLSQSTLSGVTAQASGTTTTYTFPFDVTKCIPVVSGFFESGFYAFQSGTAPENKNKVTVHGSGATADHNLILVCP